MNHDDEGRKFAEEDRRRDRRRVSFKMDLNNENSCPDDEDLDRKRKACATTIIEFRNIHVQKRVVSSNILPPTTCTSSTCRDDKLDNNVKRKSMGKPVGILRVHSSRVSSPPAGPVPVPDCSLFKHSTLLEALKRSNETRGWIEKLKKRILRRVENEQQQQQQQQRYQAAHLTRLSSSPSNNGAKDEKDEELHNRRRIRMVCAIQSTKAMMAQTLPQTMMPFVEKILKSSTHLLLRHRRYCMGSNGQGGGQGRVIHRILIDQHKRMIPQEVEQDENNKNIHGQDHDSRQSSESP